MANKLPCNELSEEIEVDESYSGGVKKGKRGHGAGGKITVFLPFKAWRKSLYSNNS